ncbi:hypothetical protein [Amycolatopsis keratiniphila]|uniref:Uncharacterized protein n=1 Tax=Amycolatopsis keratiniphila subsp. keratiniphila TaxID=227715 RepID=A0A1W2M3X6_9PSEU|nr:hypothetical protein [Amycolatopsis keratiniphila]ONF74864.1 hypothetical protein AVR91_0201485 [Amycolatopsis keratiniphila subsp. keratiniphila]
MKRWVTLTIGLVFLLVGGVWVLQGAGVLTGSFMTGQKLWFLIGLVAFLVGVVLVAATAAAHGRPPVRTGPTSHGRYRRTRVIRAATRVIGGVTRVIGWRTLGIRRS